MKEPVVTIESLTVEPPDCLPKTKESEELFDDFDDPAAALDELSPRKLNEPLPERLAFLLLSLKLG